MGRSLAERQRFALTMEPAEFRMRFQRVLERAAAGAEVPEEPVPGPYLTVSREVASGGSELARRVGQILEWSVLDRELVHNLATRLELEPRLLELMDETRVNWFSESLLNLFNSRLVLQDSFVWKSPLFWVGSMKNPEGT